jgi:hypothetical protein
MADNESSRKKVRPNEADDGDVEMAVVASSSSTASSSSGKCCCMPTMPFQIAPDLQDEMFASRPVEVVKDLLKSAGLFKLLPRVAAFKFEGAETMFKAKNVLLVDENNTVLSPGWVATRSGNIVAVGDESAMQPWLGTRTKFVDLGDATITPGLIEPHMV